MPEGYHPPLEEYLEAIHELTEDGVQVIQARLVERLDHSAPTVSETVRNLADQGYVRIKDREISLTAKGRTRAASVVRKHRLAERLLTDVIGVAWHRSHDEATRWEHVISDEVEERLTVMLGNPATCPHGNPIPGSGVTLPKLVPLASAAAGDDVVLQRVTEQVEFDEASLTYLGENGFMPGTHGLVRTRTPDGTLLIEVNGKTLAIGARLAKALFISPIEETAKAG